MFHILQKEFLNTSCMFLAYLLSQFQDPSLTAACSLQLLAFMSVGNFKHEVGVTSIGTTFIPHSDLKKDYTVNCYFVRM
jgi:hypothetical protein